VRNLKKYMPFIAVWFVNSLVLYVAFLVFPKNIVFGNYFLTDYLAAIWTGLLLTSLCKLSKKLRVKSKLKIKGRNSMFLYYWVINAVIIWVLARIPDLTGFGIASYYWVIALALVLNFSQWGTRQVLKSQKLK
jgi:uncharacterized membrane protein YvlD (DUF360 family)